MGPGRSSRSTSGRLCLSTAISQWYPPASGMTTVQKSEPHAMPHHLFHKGTPEDYREVLRVCLPLVLSMSATTVMEFTDRVFLSNYSIDAIAAAVPAGITSYVFLAFFGGVSGYAGVFIAQYYGSGTHGRIGGVLWQGLWFSLFAGIICWLLAITAAKPIFALAGHAEAIRVLEEIYFSILCKGAFLHIGVNVLSAFFTGRGITRPVMLITFMSVLLNIPLDYAMIYGKWGMAELGITGAALATVSSWGVSFLLLAILIFTRKNERNYRAFSSWPLDWDLMARLLRYGIPGALQFTVDILAFTIFILLVGRIDTVALAATNIVLSINAVAFMPSMGVSQGVSVMVGQALGRRDAAGAGRSINSAIHLLLAYILLVDLFFIFFPGTALAPFVGHVGSPEQIEDVMATGRQLLRIISLYLFMDALYMTYSGALKGAGDTRFLMASISISSILFLILPVYIGITWLDMDVIGAWLFVLLFVMVLFLLAAGRYRAGKWRHMLVIEKEFQRR